MSHPATNWDALARAGARRRFLSAAAMGTFMVIISVPIVLAYLWMLVVAFTGSGETVETAALWRLCAVLVPAFLAAAFTVAITGRGRKRQLALAALSAFSALMIVWLLWDDWNLSNFRFLVTADITGMLGNDSVSTGYSQIPSVWTAFGNSLFLAIAQTAIVITVSTLAGYYLSRFAFRGRSQFLQGMLILQAFPAMTLIIPLFVIVFKVGLLNTLWGPMLVITTLELPFFIFIMKGFFDAVPWDIERSALTDGATRIQAFRLVVLPQVTGGMIAVGVFAFIKGWEEYVFVSALRTGDGLWLMSTYLFYVSQEVMGVDYGLVAAVSVFYVLPSLFLYLFFQKYLTQMSVGGVKG